MKSALRACALVPVYNHTRVLEALVKTLEEQQLPVLLIDDGSDADCREQMRAIAARHPKLELLHRERNGGKGAAVKTGLAAAAARGFSHALQVDADGQHDLDDVPALLQLAADNPDALVAAWPVFDDSIPALRYYGRYATHIWVWINTLSTEIKDSMCGFRVYPVAASCELAAASRLGNRMDFDTEFIVHWFWSGRAVRQMGTRVRYPEDGNSHYHYLRDNWLVSRMHTRLFFGMLRRAPRLLGRRMQQS